MEAQNDVETHNREALQSLEIGDLVEYKRCFYSHWAVYVGDTRIVHLTSDGGSSEIFNSGSVGTVCGLKEGKAIVKEDDFWKPTCGYKAFKNNGKDKNMSPSGAEEIVERAKDKIGEKGYNALWNNCEHFASYCRYGISKSYQAARFLSKAYQLLRRVVFETAHDVVPNVIAKTRKYIDEGKFPVGVCVAVAITFAVDAYVFEGKFAIQVEKVLARDKSVGGLVCWLLLLLYMRLTRIRGETR